MNIFPGRNGPGNAAPHGLRRRRFLPALAIAAGVVLACTMGARARSNWLAQPLMVKACSTAPGEQAEVQLSDGSRLLLDGATRLEVRYYPRRREVILFEGQVRFDVQADDDRIFQVQAGTLRTTVKDARFAVRHVPGAEGNEKVRVAVERGSVRVHNVTAKSADHAVQLAAGQQVWGTVHGVTALSQLGASDVSPWL